MCLQQLKAVEKQLNMYYILFLEGEEEAVKVNESFRSPSIDSCLVMGFVVQQEKQHILSLKTTKFNESHGLLLLLNEFVSLVVGQSFLFLMKINNNIADYYEVCLCSDSFQSSIDVKHH